MRAADVRVDSLPKSELTRNITSYSESKGAETYLLGFYDDQGDGLLHLPLRLLRYERASNAITQAAIQGLSAPFGDTPSQLPDLCAGSVLAIRHVAGHVLVSTHINPSAGCELVFSEQFELQASLTGWLIANLRSDQFLLHENEVHFASQHALSLKIADLAHRKITKIYPPERDRMHSEYVGRLRSHMPPRQWCIETDSICDPSSFNCDLDGAVAVSPDLNTFGFIVEFNAGGFGPAAESAVPSERVAYVYRWNGGSWRMRREIPATATLRAGQLVAP